MFVASCRLTGAERLLFNENVTINTAHVFLKDSWYVTDKLTVYPGLSAHNSDLTDESFIEPRFALEYAARDDLIWSAGGEEFHQ